jgi:hypothetical protein
VRENKEEGVADIVAECSVAGHEREAASSDDKCIWKDGLCGLWRSCSVSCHSPFFGGPIDLMSGK